jgi:hypothetical protein
MPVYRRVRDEIEAAVRKFLGAPQREPGNHEGHEDTKS